MDDVGSEIKLEDQDPIENPEPSFSTDNSTNNVGDSSDNDTDDYVFILSDPCESDLKHPFVPPSHREDAPLAGIIKPDLEDINPRYIYNLIFFKCIIVRMKQI